MSALDIIIHKNILVIILKLLFTNHSIGPHLGFKGGTAVLFFYDLKRFSVDLDFDLLTPEKSDELFELIKRDLEKYGDIEVQNKRYSLFFLLSYKNKTFEAQKLKIEINKRNFGSRYELKNYLGIPMMVMVKEDIFANKLVAMYERMGHANRDIYDVWFFFSNFWQVNKKIIELRTQLAYKVVLQKCIDLLEKVNERNILSGLGEILDEKQKNWVKKNLKNETIFYLKLALNAES